MRIPILLLSCTGLMLVASAAESAPLGYVGGEYTQDFNGLPVSLDFPAVNPFVAVVGRGPHDINGQLGTTGLEGWTMSNPEALGSSSGNTEFRAQDGNFAGSSGRGIVSFGANTSTDRSIGTLATSNQINRFGLALTNDTGGTLTRFTLAFIGEQWRRGNVPTIPEDPLPNKLTFSYALSGDPLENIDTDSIFAEVPALSFTSPNTTTDPLDLELGVNGNLPANQVALSQTVGGFSWAPNQTLFLRWTGQDLTGQDDGISIDNLRFTAGIPEPTSLVIAMMAACGVAGLRRRR